MTLSDTRTQSKEHEVIIDISAALLKKLLSGQRQRFHNDREAEMSVTQWFQSQAADITTQGYKSWSNVMTNVSVPEVNMLKNSSTLAVSVPIILSIKFGVLFIKGPRKTYFVDEQRS